jgi:DNA-binding transcriptional LysR family regulator
MRETRTYGLKEAGGDGPAATARRHLRHLRYFVAIAEHEHIGRAARVLHVSSSPLSRQIHQLEEDIGVRLLARVGRRVQLTEAGKVFHQEAREALARIDRAMATRDRLLARHLALFKR